MTLMLRIVLPIIGLFVGGVLCRLAYAYPRKAFGEVFAPTCHACGRRLPLRYTLPIVGVFLTRGRCPVCKEKRGVWSSLVAELSFAAATFLLFLYYGVSALFFLYLFAAAVLLVLSLVDLDIKEVPHFFMLLILIVGGVVFVLSFFPDYSLASTLWWEHLVGAFAVSLPLFIVMLVSRGGVGGGDVKLMFCLGFLLGYKLVLFAFLVGIVLAAIVSIVLVLAFGKNGKYAIPLVPFLAVGALVAMVWGEVVIRLLF